MPETIQLSLEQKLNNLSKEAKDALEILVKIALSFQETEIIEQLTNLNQFFGDQELLNELTYSGLVVLGSRNRYGICNHQTAILLQELLEAR